MRKTSDLSPKRGILLPLTGIPQNWQGHKNQQKPEKLSQPRGALGDMTTKCDMVSWRDPDIGKGR